MPSTPPACATISAVFRKSPAVIVPAAIAFEPPPGPATTAAAPLSGLFCRKPINSPSFAPAVLTALSAVVFWSAMYLVVSVKADKLAAAVKPGR